MITPRFASLTRLGAALALAGHLAGCAPLLVGGAVIGTGMVVADRRTAGAQLEDEGIEFRAASRIRDLATLGQVSVTSFNRLLLLTGEVASEEDRTAIEQTLSRIENVRSVINELGVTAPSSIGTRSNDTLLTSKVKASMVDAKDVQSGAYKVVTERSVVYLMGRVTEREANRAADIARGVSGVAKVVKVFEVVTEGELAGTAPVPAAAAIAASAPKP